MSVIAVRLALNYHHVLLFKSSFLTLFWINVQTKKHQISMFFRIAINICYSSFRLQWDVNCVSRSFHLSLLFSEGQCWSLITYNDKWLSCSFPPRAHISTLIFDWQPVMELHLLLHGSHVFDCCRGNDICWDSHTECYSQWMPLNQPLTQHPTPPPPILAVKTCLRSRTKIMAFPLQIHQYL